MRTPSHQNSLLRGRDRRVASPSLAVARRRAAPTAIVLLALATTLTPSHATDWTNSGANAGRNSAVDVVGPSSASVRWAGARSSLIAWLPVTDATSLYTVRQPKWPDQQPNDAFIVAHDLVSGVERWARVLPYNTGDWIPWVGGVNGGRVYCSRSGNGASISAKLFALDVADGHTLWESTVLQDMGSYDGLVFAADGDPVVASFQDIWRFNAEDGALVWHSTRVGSVSGNCGGAVHGNALYVADAAAGGHVMVKYDLTTGARLYQSPLMPGFTIQNTPMVGPDGTVYLNRAQSNVTVDFYYAFTDTGSGFVEKWHVGGMSGAGAELGVGPDGSVYVITPGPRISRLDPNDGSVMHQTAILSGFSTARFAIDGLGRVFFSNGAFATGRLYSFEADLTPRWDVAVTNINIGGPTLAVDGTLIACGVGTDLRAFYTPSADVPALATRLGFDLLPAFPNPFTGDTELRLVTERPADLHMDVIDANGRIVRRLLDHSMLAGESRTRWDGMSDDGRRVAAGAYFVRLTDGRGTATRRVVLLR